MTADKDGVVVSLRTIRWIELAVLLVALAGPVVSYVVTTKVMIARQELIDKRQDERIDGHDEMFHEKDARYVRIDTRLQSIEQTLNRIAGKLEK